jgi:hypothetical protein
MGFAADLPDRRTGLREDEIGAREEDRPWAQGGVKEKGWEEIGPIASTFQRGGQEGQTFIHPVIDTAVIVGELLVTMRDANSFRRRTNRRAPYSRLNWSRLPQSI